MASENIVQDRDSCPRCNRKGRRVSAVTLRSLLKEEYARHLPGDAESGCTSDETTGEGCCPVSVDAGWRFCDSPDCDVVYFSERDDTVFVKSQLKVSVGIKEQAGERPLCYCFGHSVASIKEELRSKGHSGALEDIRAKMKDPGCRCETTNPSGSCCLGSVAKGIKIAQEELGMNHLDRLSGAVPTETSGSRGETIAKIGAIVSAIAASSCCWLPLVLLAVGVSGAGIASALEAYRPWFIAVTFGFLGTAFYFTYRPRKAAAVGGDDCCSTEATSGADCCTRASGRGFTMMSVNKMMLWIVTVMAVAFLFFPSYVGALLGSGDDNVVTTDMKRIVIHVEGMTCEGCSATVAQAIRSVPGVQAVTVSYARQEAIVGTDSRRPVSVARILESIEKAGYHGTHMDQANDDQGQVTSRE